MDWVSGAVIVAAIIAVVVVVVEYIQRKPDQFQRDAEIQKLHGQIEAHKKHIEFLENHVERHANNREKAEVRLDNIMKILETKLVEQGNKK